MIQKEDLSNIRTLEEWNRVWTGEILAGVVKESTRTMYRDTMERHILSFFGNSSLKELTPERISEWISWLQNEEMPGTIKGRMTEGTVRNTLSVLSGCLRDAQKYGLIEENPCRKPSWKIPGKNLWEQREFLEEEQIRHLETTVLEYRNKKGYPEGLLFQLMLYAGLTMSEAAALRWRDVELEKQTLHIRYFAEEGKASKKKDGMQSADEAEVLCQRAVGKRKRSVPMPDVLQNRLMRVKEEYQPGEEDFVTTGESTMSRINCMRAALWRRSERTGQGRIAPRMFRDTYAIRAVQAGATSDMIADLMGFASPQQVVRRYMPHSPVDKQSLVNKMYPL